MLTCKRRCNIEHGEKGHVPPLKGYTLAKKHSIGYGSAKTTAELGAGDAHQGAVKDVGKTPLT